MTNSIATALAGLMFVMGVALVGISPKLSSVDAAAPLSAARLKPSVEMLKSF